MLVTSLSLFATYLGWQLTNNYVDRHARAQFVSETHRLETEILDRFAVYEEVVLGGVGLFRASGEVTRSEWSNYVDTLNLSNRLPGIQGLGFAATIDSENLDEHTASIRLEGFPEYDVNPSGARETYTAIVYLEPFDWRNQRAFGYDMFSEPTRREAMIRARDSGKFAMSGRVELAQETDTDIQPGFLLYHAIYDNNHEPLSRDELKAALVGYVFSAFRAGDLMNGLLNDEVSTVNFQIYDGRQVDPSRLLFDGSSESSLSENAMPRFQRNSVVSIAGREWILDYSTTRAFDVAFDRFLPQSILTAGFIMSLMMGVIAIMLVTTRSRVETRTEELRNQEMLNSHLLENLVDAVVVCDNDGAFTMVNKVARNWLEVEGIDVSNEGSVLDFRVYSSKDERLLAHDETPLARALTGKVLNNEEVCLIPKSTERRYTMVSGGPVTDVAGEQVGAVLVMKDITTRRELAEEARRQKRFLRQVIDLSPHLVFAKDRHGRFLLVNEAMAEAYGVAADELIGRTEADVNPNTEEVALLQEEERQVLESEAERAVLEKRCFSSTVNGRWYDTVRRPVMSPDGEVLQLMGVSIDITEQRRTAVEVENLAKNLEKRVAERTDRLRLANEQLEIAKADAEHANKAKSTFLASMSHEIRTPMNGVVGMIEVLDQSKLNTDQAEVVKTIRESAYSLLDLIDNVLDFSKIEAGALELEAAPVPLWELAGSSCDSLSQLAHRQGVDLSLYIDPDTPLQIRSDAMRLRQVICNLVGNAIKFSGGRGDTRGRVRVRLSGSDFDGRTVRLEVSDNGIGMTQDSAANLFNSFTQAESSTTRRFGGSGLGLAICKRIVDLMCGQINVESTPGKGSTFTVSLPAEVLGALPQQESIDVSDVNIIMVSGDFVSFEDLRALVGEQHKNISAADSLQQAIEMAASQSLTVIVAQDFGRDTSELKMSEVIKVSSKATNARVLLLAWGRHFRNTEIDDYVVTHNASRLDKDSFCNALAVAAGRASPEDFHNKVSLSLVEQRDERPAPTISESRRTGSLVLVAEDDSTNQKVILRQLELLGYAAEVACNGSDALDMWRSNNYLLLLSDLHMPEMDGYQLAEAIRKEEDASERMPIIALTANALRGEVSRAKEAGMDEYLTKPVKLSKLEATLNQWAAVAAKQRDQREKDGGVIAEADVIAVADDVLDLDVLSDLVGDDNDAIIEILADFLLSAREGAAKLKTLNEVSGVQEMKAIAHRLKSSARAVGAAGLGDICSELENACRTEDSAAVRRRLREFDEYFVKVAKRVSRRIEAA